MLVRENNPHLYLKQRAIAPRPQQQQQEQQQQQSAIGQLLWVPVQPTVGPQQAVSRQAPAVERPGIFNQPWIFQAPVVQQPGVPHPSTSQQQPSHSQAAAPQQASGQGRDNNLLLKIRASEARKKFMVSTKNSMDKMFEDMDAIFDGLDFPDKERIEANNPKTQETLNKMLKDVDDMNDTLAPFIEANKADTLGELFQNNTDPESIMYDTVYNRIMANIEIDLINQGT